MVLLVTWSCGLALVTSLLLAPPRGGLASVGFIFFTGFRGIKISSGAWTALQTGENEVVLLVSDRKVLRGGEQEGGSFPADQSLSFCPPNIQTPKPNKNHD